MLVGENIPLLFLHCSWTAKPQKWRIKGTHGVNDEKVCSAIYNRTQCYHVLSFQSRKKKKAYSSSSVIQYPWSKVSQWQERKLGWTLKRIRCDCTHKISGMRENQFNGMSYFLSISKCFFLILLVPIKGNPTGKYPSIANGWLNVIMNLCSADGTYHCMSVAHFCLKLQ